MYYRTPYGNDFRQKTQLLKKVIPEGGKTATLSIKNKKSNPKKSQESNPANPQILKSCSIFAPAYYDAF
jgi:hypothetical protein